MILTSVPVQVKSLCGGMVRLILPLLIKHEANKPQLNTAFQIGSGVALAISAAVTEAVDIDKGHGLAQQYSTGLWCSAGVGAVGLIIGLVAVRRQGIGPDDRDGEPVAL